MPPIARPPRLWLKPAAEDRAATWIILYSGKHYSTGCKEHEIEKARAALDNFLVDYKPTADKRAGWNHANIGFIYFISTNDVAHFPVKIGWAKTSAAMRLTDLQIACPYNLRIMATERGSRGLELKLHRQFGHLRMRGEWFQRGHDLMDHIRDLIHGTATNEE